MCWWRCVEVSKTRFHVNVAGETAKCNLTFSWPLVDTSTSSVDFCSRHLDIHVVVSIRRHTRPIENCACCVASALACSKWKLSRARRPLWWLNRAVFVVKRMAAVSAARSTQPQIAALSVCKSCAFVSGGNGACGSRFIVIGGREGVWRRGREGVEQNAPLIPTTPLNCKSFVVRSRATAAVDGCSLDASCNDRLLSLYLTCLVSPTSRLQ